MTAREEKESTVVADRTGSAIMVDFADLTFIYALGRGLLTRMYRQGVMLVSSGLLVKAVIARTNHGARAYQDFSLFEALAEPPA